MFKPLALVVSITLVNADFNKLGEFAGQNVVGKPRIHGPIRDDPPSWCRWTPKNPPHSRTVQRWLEAALAPDGAKR